MSAKTTSRFRTSFGKTLAACLMAGACSFVALLPGCSSNNDALNSSNVAVRSYDIDQMPAGASIPDMYIVVLKEEGIQSTNVNVKDAVQSLTSSVGISMDNVQNIYAFALKGFAARMSAAQAAALQKDSRVKFVEQDQVVKLEPCTVAVESNKSAATIQAQTTPWGVTRVGGAGDGSFSVTGKRAYVIDTGVDLDHSDLTVDVSRSKTYVTSGQDSRNADDRNGHGSHVSGIIAAKNNTNMVVGVAAGATIVAVKVLNGQGSGQNSWVIAGVDYVRNNASAGDVANMSLGGGVSTALDNAVTNAANAGIKFSIAAGNSSANANNSSPARVNHANVYTISAVGTNDAFASFSNYGNPPVDYAAPGVSIPSLYKNNGTATMSGTSMAAPHVAGILLLGSVSANGTASGDPDGTADPIAHR